MKLTIAFFGLLFTLTAASRASAQTTPYDSAFLQSPLVYYFGTVTDTNSLFGKADRFSCHFGADGELAARFRVGSEEITMQKGDSIHIYWNIPSIAPGDSNVGVIRLQRVDDNQVPNGYDSIYYIKEASQTNSEGMTTLVVPDTGRNGIGIAIAADSGGSSFWIDAIVLIQKGTAGVMDERNAREAVLASYPNPFEHSSRVAVHIDAPASGHGELWISDALGREVERVAIGELSAGGRDVSLALDRAGIFFARLVIDGAPTGAPLKLVAE